MPVVSPWELPQVHQRPLRGILGSLSGATAFVPEFGRDVFAVNEDVGAPGSTAA